MSHCGLPRTASDVFDDDRPAKRQKLSPTRTLISAPSTVPGSDSTGPCSKPLLHSELLLNFPTQFLHPPTHQFFPGSIALCLCALRRVLRLPISQLTPSVEVRALTGIVELGLLALDSGFLSQNHDRETEWAWTRGLREEIQSSLTHALHLSTTHPTLSLYIAHLNLLHTRFLVRASEIPNIKQVRNILKRLLVTALEKEGQWGSHIVYEAYLALVDHYLEFEDDAGEAIIINLLDRMIAHARGVGDENVTLFCDVLKLRLCFIYSRWDEAGDVLQRSERHVDLGFPSSSTLPEGTDLSLEPASTDTASSQSHHSLEENDPFIRSLKVHVLLLSVLYWSVKGFASQTGSRLDRLHAELDSGLLKDLPPSGNVQISLHSDPTRPFWVSMTPPTLLTMQSYLVSAEAKRDVVGRKVKRRIFALEGIKVVERSMRRCGAALTPGMSVPALHGAEAIMARIKADCICETISVALMRSEFKEAETRMNELTKWTLQYEDRAGMWSEFCPRIVLYQAQLYHALGIYEKAIRCYRVSGGLARGELDCSPASSVEEDEKRSARVDQFSTPRKSTSLNFAQASSPCSSLVTTEATETFKTPVKRAKLRMEHSTVRSGAPTPPSRTSHFLPFLPPTVSTSRTPGFHRSGAPTPSTPTTPLRTWSPSRTPTRRIFGVTPLEESNLSQRRRKNAFGSSRERKGTDQNADEWVDIVSGVGEVLLRLGLARRKIDCTEEDGSHSSTDEMLVWVRERALELSERCGEERWGGQLDVVGVLMQAVHCFCLHGYWGDDDEDDDGDGTENNGEKWGLDAKSHMRTLLQCTKTQNDPYLRALAMGLIASFYVYTAEDHVQSMLNTTEILATGLGAPSKKGEKKVQEETDGWGHVPLRLWVAERNLDLAFRLNDRGNIPKLKKLVEILQGRIEDMKIFGDGLGGGSAPISRS